MLGSGAWSELARVSEGLASRTERDLYFILKGHEMFKWMRGPVQLDIFGHFRRWGDNLDDNPSFSRSSFWHCRWLSSSISDLGTILSREGRGCIVFVPLRMLHSSANSTWKRHVCARFLSFGLSEEQLLPSEAFRIHQSQILSWGYLSSLKKYLWFRAPGRGSCVQPVFGSATGLQRRRGLEAPLVFVGHRLSRQMVNISTRWRWTERPVQNEGRSVKEIPEPSRHVTGNGAGNLN